MIYFRPVLFLLKHIRPWPCLVVKALPKFNHAWYVMQYWKKGLWHSSKVGNALHKPHLPFLHFGWSNVALKDFNVMSRSQCCWKLHRTSLQSYHKKEYKIFLSASGQAKRNTYSFLNIWLVHACQHIHLLNFKTKHCHLLSWYHNLV